MKSQRSSGVLLHPTSLPGKYGIGDIGPEAYKFIDFLVDAGQSIWQILPLGHTSYGDSPYMCLSAFGGNPYLISPEKLVDEKLLDDKDIATPPDFDRIHVDYGAVLPYKKNLLDKAFHTFQAKYSQGYPEDYYDFVQENSFWLEDYALFTAVKNYHDGVEWTKWQKGISRREPDALVEWRNKLSTEIQFWKFVQYVFFKQWAELKEYCHKKGVLIIGDIPVYVAHDSAEVWANKDLFHLDDYGNALAVAGVPPDYFSATGQRWGNPIYRWEEMEKRGFRWWIDRFRTTFTMVDTVRLDHFRGFEAFWEIPASEPTAINGIWVKGPGKKLFHAVSKELGEIQMIAEDLGVITPEVDALRDELGFPGMRILQMAFGDDPKASEYKPHNHVQNSVVYTASHDHNTTVGWFTAEPGSQTTQTPEQVARERKNTLDYLKSDGKEIHWDFIRMALGSVSCMAIFPMQDLFGLGSESRMNLPGTATGNWKWRFTEDMLNPDIQSRLYRLTEIYERLPK